MSRPGILLQRRLPDLWAVMGFVAAGCVGFATSFLAAHLLSPDGRGVVSAAQIVPTLITPLAAGGLADAVALWRGEANEFAIAWVAMRRSFTSAAVAVGIGAVVVVTLYGRKSFLLPSLWYLLMAVFAGSYQIVISPLRRTGRMREWSLARLATAMVWLTILTVATVFGMRRAVWLLVAYLAGHLLVTLIGARRLRAAAAGHVAPDRLAAELHAIGRPTALAQFMQILSLRMDLLILPALVSTADYGKYAVASNWSWITVPWLTGASTVLAARLARRVTGLRRVVRRFGLLGIAASVVIAGGGALVTAPLFGRVFGARYADAMPVARLLVVGGALGALNTWLGELCRIDGKRWIPASGEAIGLVGYVALFLLLRRTMPDLRASAVATVIGLGAVTVVLAFGLWSERGSTSGPPDAPAASGEP